MTGLLGKKLKMSQIWKKDKVVPVTVVEVPQNLVSRIKNLEKDGYQAVQLQAGRKKLEFRIQNLEGVQKGNPVDVTIFKEGDKVRVSGITKGRGFQGVVKRHGFHGGPKTHGQKNRFRAPGSIGSTAPQRVWPGRRMAGHMGTERVTIKNLVVAEVDAEKKLLYIKGAVPGPIGGYIEIRKVN